MDNKVIEVLDYVGEKLGIAIDWTSENVMPQVMEFIGRYRVYEIVSCSISIIFCVVTVIVAIHYLKKIVMQLHNGNGFWYDADEFAVVAIAICFAAIFVCGTIALVNIWDVVGWAIVPEMKFFEVLTRLVENSK